MGKWTLVIVILIASLVASAAMMQSMGLIDITGMMLDQLEAIPAFRSHASVYRLGLRSGQAIEEERQKQQLLEEEVARLKAQLADERAEWEREVKELDKERERLKQWERQLQARQETINAQIENMKSMDKLQQIYEAMRPADVTPILSELDETVVAYLLSGMDERTAAGILRAMEPENAARISQLLGGISTK